MSVKAGPKGRRSTHNEDKTEPPWNVVPHNDRNRASKAVIVPRRHIPGMTLVKATGIMWETHTTARTIATRCHKELAELYRNELAGDGLTASIEPARSWQFSASSA